MRGASARLIDVDDEVLAVLACENFVCCFDDCVRKLRVESSRLLVRQRRRALDPYCGIDECRQWSQRADRKILNCAECLHAVKRVGGDLKRAQRILLGASLFAHSRGE